MPIDPEMAMSQATRSVETPGQFTQKMIIGFMDENSQPVWTKLLLPLNVEINQDSMGELRMLLELSLRDVFGNET